MWFVLEAQRVPEGRALEDLIGTFIVPGDFDANREVRSSLLRYAVKGWQGAAVSSTSGTLTDALGDPERLKSFDVLLVGCDFSTDGTAENATLQAIRAVAAEPRNPAVILLTTKGSEYTAVQVYNSR